MVRDGWLFIILSCPFVGFWNFAGPVPATVQTLHDLCEQRGPPHTFWKMKIHALNSFMLIPSELRSQNSFASGLFYYENQNVADRRDPDTAGE